MDEKRGTDLVFDVGHVHDKIHFITKVVSEDTPDHVLRQVVSTQQISIVTLVWKANAPRVTHMGSIIHRRTTVVPIHTLPVHRYELVLPQVSANDGAEN
jgi:hypothetical protein